MTGEDSELTTQLAALGRKKAYFEVGKLLSEQDDDAVYKLVEDDLSSTDTGIGSLTLTLIKGGSALAESGQTLSGSTVLGTVCSACVGQICEDSADPETQKWTTISDTLLQVLPQLGPRSIIDIAFRILAELKTSGALPTPLAGFLPMLLDTMGMIGAVEITSEDVGAAEDDVRVTRTGSELKAYWIESACTYKWHAQASVRVCALLRELVLTEAQVERVSARIQRQMECMELTELPAMVYQLLLLSRSGSKREIVGGIFTFFDNMEKQLKDARSDNERKRWRELGDIEGTIMLHISYGIKQDFELGDALIGFAKDTSDSLSSFSFACLLSLARIHRFEDTVTTLLRTQLLRSMHDEEMRVGMVWVRPYLLESRSDARELLYAVVERSSYGWDQVTQSLIQLCITTVDYTARRNTYSPVACEQARQTCIRVLQTAFTTHEFVRGEIVDQILSRVVFQTESHMHFLDLLQLLVANDVDVVRTYSAKIIDSLDSISVMSSRTLEGLVRAVAPMFLDDVQFRSSLVLVLRKILFARGVDERRVALSGLFVLISCVAQSLDWEGERRQNNVRLAVLLEVLGLLRRCLTQQPEIRKAAYEQLSMLLDEPFARRNAALLGTLHGIFQTEFAKYQTDRSHDSPINFQLCVSPITHKVVMPVASFMQCFAKLTLALDELDGSALVSSGSESASIWTDVCTRFSRAQMEDFELDANGDFALDSPSGVRNNNTARLVIGCIDAAIEYELCSTHDMVASNPAMVIELFSKFQRFSDVLCTRCVDERKKRVIGAASDLSHMSLTTVLKVLELVLSDPRRMDNPDHALNCGPCDRTWFVAHVNGASLWAANTAFVRHLLEIALARVTERTGSVCVEPTHKVLHVAYVAYSGALAACARPCESGILDLPTNLAKRSAKARSILYVAAETLVACTNVLQSRGQLHTLHVAVMRPQPMLFAPNVDPPTIDPPTIDPLLDAQYASALITGLRNTSEQMLAQKPVMAREATSTLTSLHATCVQLAHTGYFCTNAGARAVIYKTLNETARWAFSLVGGELPGDASLLRNITLVLTACQPFLQPETVFARPPLQLTLSVPDVSMPDVRMDDYELGTLSRLISSICTASRLLTNIDPDSNETDEDEPNLGVFTARTIPALITVLAAWFKAELHDLDWASTQLRRTSTQELAMRPEGDSEDLHASIQLERRVCKRIHALSQLLLQLLSTVMPTPGATDQVIRVFHDLHRTFAHLTRIKLQCVQVPITESYIDCLSLICSTLNTHAHSMIIDKYGALVGSADAEKPNKKAKLTSGSVGKARVLRNSAVVSSLVYQMELTEKYVGQVAARHKTPLAHYLKRSLARDFRIERDRLHDPLQDMGNSPDEPGDTMLLDSPPPDTD
ncbi:hypothetical protein IW147_001491 [Coemansia sp. RSA 720]|nr:hypothetical protein IW147_001491 [Coemansia sp. RSA 720]